MRSFDVTARVVCDPVTGSLEDVARERPLFALFAAEQELDPIRQTVHLRRRARGWPCRTASAGSTTRATLYRLVPQALSARPAGRRRVRARGARHDGAALSGAAHLGGGPLDRPDDRLVAGAAARLPARPSRIASSVGSGSRARSAAAAMSMPGVQNPHWIPPPSRNAVWSGWSASAAGEALDGRDLAARGLEREVRARVHRPAVDQDHARAALGVVAALLRAGPPEVVTEDAEERSPGVDRALSGWPSTVSSSDVGHASDLLAVGPARGRDRDRLAAGTGRRGGERPARRRPTSIARR